jgi:hypothetical protein
MNPITWRMKIPFFKNTYLLRSVFIAYLFAIGGVSIIVSTIFIIDGDGDQLAAIAVPMLGVFAFIFVLMLFSTWIVIGNKYALEYQLDQEGILISGINDKGKDIRKLAIVAGILTASPGVVGAGLLVRDDVIFIPWEDMAEVEFDEAARKVVIKCTFMYQVAVHYPMEKGNQVLQYFEENLN